MRAMNYDDYRLIGIPFRSQLVRETRLLHNRTYLYSNQSRFIVLLLAEIILALNCLIGDYYIFQSITAIDLIRSKISISERLVRALMDSASHFTVAFISWFIINFSRFSDNQDKLLGDLILVGVMASLVDLDHFLAAKSLSIVQATSLSKRPFLHNSLTLLIINLAIYLVILKLWGPKAANRISLMIFIAWFTHHVRDANRRGLWFGFMFTTPPLQKSIYIGIILILPLLVRYDLLGWLQMMLPSRFRLFLADKSTMLETHII